MARASGNRPTHYISVTAKVGRGKYEKGPFIGLWIDDGKFDNAPMFKGAAKGQYLDELYDFIKKYGEEEIGFAIFKSQGEKGGRGRGGERDEGDESRPRRGRGDDDAPRGRRDNDEPRGKNSREENEAPAGRGRRSSEKDWFTD